MSTTSFDFLPILLMFIFGVTVALIISGLTHILGRRKLNPVKQDLFECGIPQLSTGRLRFAIHFYIVAIIFLIFDLETVVILPWAVVFKQLVNNPNIGWAVPLISLLVFLFILIVGFIYEVKKGAMKWE